MAKENYQVTPVDSYALKRVNGTNGESSTDDNIDKQDEEEIYEHENPHGLHWIVTAIFIVGEMVGGGLVAMPSAMINAGLVPGIGVTLLGAITSGYTGWQLGDNWIMMQNRGVFDTGLSLNRWREYRLHCRKPYSEMAYRAMGTKAKHFVSVCLVLTQFSISVVFLLLAGKNISSMLNYFFAINFHFCYIILIVAVGVYPFLLLGSPKDFWQAAVGAAVSTTIAIILILINTAHDATECMSDVDFPPVTYSGFFLAYGTIIFAYGGHGAFPTIQHDMKKPHLFNRSVTVAYIIIVCMYLPVCIFCYLVYGGSLKDSVIPSLQNPVIQQAVSIMITVHVVFTIVIIYSPLSQGVEDFLKVEHKFGLPRILIRAALLTFSTFVALSVPNFGVVLDLVGGSTITLMTMVLPAIFYLYLIAGEAKRKDLIKRGLMKREDPDDVRASLYEIFTYTGKPLLIFNIFVLLVGILGGLAATSSAIHEIVNSEVMTPCYVQYFYGKLDVQGPSGTVNCCGSNGTITTMPGVLPEDVCSAFN